MADLKITGLDALAEASIQATDALAIADLSATETKKVTVKDLIAAGVALIDSGDIPAAKVAAPFAANSVATATIQNDAINADKLATDSVTADAVAANAIGASELADNAVDSGALVANSVITTKILDLNVTSDKIASNAITTVKILDANVTYAKLNLSDGDISGAKITGNSITNAQIGADAVGTSELADNAVDTAAILNAAVTGTKIAADTIESGNIAANAVGASELADASVDTAAIVANAVTTAKIADGEVTTAKLAGSITGDKLSNSTVTYAKLSIADGDIAGAKITGNSITAAQIAANAVTASELADDAVDTAAVVDGAITTTQIAANTITAGNLAANSVGASELADNAVDTAAVVNGAITTDKIADGAITTAKLDGTISASSIADNSVTSAKIAANAVGASELADNAVDTAAIAASAVIDSKIASGISGTKITDGTVTAAKLNTSNLDRSLNVASGNLGINNTITAATRSGITYNAQGLITASAALVAGDLPVATTSAVGGVSVSTGLTVSGAGALSLTNSVTGATVSGITFNNQGMITAATGLTAAMLPVSTTSAKGAVQITSGGGLTVDGSGNLATSTSGISAGTYQSITVNNKGIATAGAALTEALIPSLAASKITSGSFSAARIANDSIDGSKLSNASTAVFQSIAQSGYPTAQFNGQILFDTVSEDAFIWDGNAWQAITTLTKGSLVFGGTFNANTSQMVATTSAGIAAGLAVGSNLPTPSATTDGVYVVVSSSGTPSAPAPVVALAPPDYVLGITNSGGSSWNEVDLSQTVAGQIASNITFTPYGQISATNVQDALQELETEKMGLAGGTCTGQLLISNTGSIVFEGSTVDAHELTLAVTDPQSSDKTITFPDITGTLITTADTNTVTSTMVDGSLVNTNLAANAAIAFSKLAALNSAQIIVGNGSNVPTAVGVTGDISINNAGLTAIATGVIVNSDISNSAAITGSKVTTGTTSAVGVLQLTDSTSSTSATTAATPNAVKTAYDLANTANTTANAALPKAGGTMTGNLIVDNAKEVRFTEADSNGANYLALKAPDSVTADITWTLPNGDGSANQFLKTDGSGNLSWGTDSTTDSTKLPLAGGTMSGALNMGSQNITNAGTVTGTFVGNITGNVTGNASGSAGSCTGNAATATALASSVNIGGVAFDGTSSITLPGVNASGTQDTSGTAALATSFTVTANDSTDETVYPLFADGATGSQGAETDTGLTYNPSTGLLTSTGFSGVGTLLTALNASNLSSGTVATARLGSGSSVTTKFLRGDNTWQTVSSTPEGTAILSTGESGATKFLREDGDGTCSWQTVVTSASGSNTQVQFNNSGAFAGSSSLTFNSGTGALTATSFSGSGASLTALNGSNIASGTIAAARIATLNQSTTGSAATLTTARAINGVDFDGSAAITVTAAAGTLTGTELKSTVVTSSLTSVGTLTSLAVTNNATIGGNAVITGDLTVQGTTTSIDTTNLDVEDRNITLGKVSSPSDATADGGGITLKGASDKSFNWVNSTDAWTSSEHIKVASGKTFIGDGSTLTALNATNLASGTVATARLGSGTGSSSNFLRGDGSWQTISLDKIEEGNTSVEAVDTGSDGHVKITTEGTERVRVGTAGEIGLSGANYGTTGQVLTSAGSGSAPQWSAPAGGVSIAALLKLTNL